METRKLDKGGGEGFPLGRLYTPLYENGIKKTQIKSMETTILKIYFFILLHVMAVQPPSTPG